MTEHDIQTRRVDDLGAPERPTDTIVVRVSALSDAAVMIPRGWAARLTRTIVRGHGHVEATEQQVITELAGDPLDRSAVGRLALELLRDAGVLGI